VASGYLEGRPTSDLLKQGAAGFVNKPFEIRDFLLIVREILDQTVSRRRPVQAPEGISAGSDEDDRTASGVPLPPAEAPRAREASTAGEFSASLRILAIDDREPYLRMLEAGLLQFGHTPLTASSGVEGLRVFRESPPDLVICDLGMPDLDGWEVSRRIEEICREKAVPKTPFILLTGDAEKEEIDRGHREKMTEDAVDAILAKPIDIPALLKVAEKLLREGMEDSD
jgi:CheY-like chemotaxis protein